MQNHQLIIKISAITRLLGFVAIVLQLISFSTRFIVYFTDYVQIRGLGFLINMFYVGAERNIPTAFSAFILIVASALLFVITALKWKKPKSFYLIWLILSFGFFYLAMDEAMILHDNFVSM